jgi:hypothetical protein
VFSQEFLKKAEDDADEYRLDQDMLSDQYKSAAGRNDTLVETIARLNEVASRNVYRIWELEKAKPFVERDVQNVAKIKELEMEVQTLKKELEKGGQFVVINAQLLARIKDLESELDTAKDFRRRFIVGDDELQVDDFFYELPPLGGEEVAMVKDKQRIHWIIRHAGYVPLDCSMFFDLPVDEVISVKDFDGYYTSYIHLSKRDRLSCVYCNMSQIVGVTLFNVVCVKESEMEKSIYFWKIANSFRHRLLDRIKKSTTKPPGAETYKKFQRFF